MVTPPVSDRLASFKAAIDAYLRQTHANRELLILVNRGDAMPIRREASIRLGLSPFAMEGEDTFVCGSNGPAFCL